MVDVTRFGGERVLLSCGQGYGMQPARRGVVPLPPQANVCRGGLPTGQGEATAGDRALGVATQRGVPDGVVEVADLSPEDYGMPSGAKSIFEMEQVKNHQSLPPDEMWIAAFTTMQNGELHWFQGNDSLRLAPRNSLVESCTKVTTHESIIWSNLVLARRVRNYLAGVADVQIPFCYVVVTKEFFFPKAFDVGSYAYYPMVVGLKKELLDGWEIRLENTPVIAQKLLNRFPMGTPEDKAIRLLGESVWARSADLEEAFVLLWRAIEVVAAIDFDRARREYAKGDGSLSLAYFNRHASDFLKEKPVRLSGLTKVLLSTKSRYPKAEEPLLKELHDLRNTIAHDATSMDQYRRLNETFGYLNVIARSVVRSVLPDPSTIYQSFQEV